MSNLVNIYYDLCKEIEILELRLQDLEADIKYSNRQVFNGSLPSTPSPVHIPFDKALISYDETNAKIEETFEWLRQKLETRKQIQGILRQLSGVEAKVAYMRDVEEKDLKSIAEELGYSVIWIKKLSQRINDKLGKQ
ncbi:hypothetical protein [Paenibacillus ehimensis]|uniref:RNA polymerase sigma-70 region 4 domain-containing protein n=1 Tax=Paenibacillus ehimensis TaxID=79264 RepID=A0ABT8VHF0_9BACL|nr:hypothetical protein [Paenibacillus ehimensis]MDO3680418.1 hypothetical protein [Paenibacillus ehimensis]